MDPFTLAGGFATIVSLLGMFKQERKGEKETHKDDFLRWLEDHGFGDTKNHLLENAALLKGIESTLKEDNQVIFEKLDRIDEVLAHLMSHVEGYSDIVGVLRPDANISDQAIDILRQLVNSNSDRFCIVQADGHYPGLLLIDDQREIDYTEHRFLDSDLRKLVELGLLNHRAGKTEKYIITRAAVNYINALAEK
jgi:hypothetical protein